MKTLTGGQRTVLILTTIPMIAVGIGGAIGTYANAASVLHRKETALGVVAAGEGATLVAALVMIVVTMLGQPAPHTVRAALWLLPLAASTMGLAIAPSVTESVVYALTPLAMTASAEGISFLARRIVVHRTGIDIEAQRKNAATMRRLAYHRARADRHPRKRVRKRSTLRVWRLMNHVGDGDAQLGSGLVQIQRDRLTEGANAALAAMLDTPPALPEPTADQPVRRDAEPEPAPEPDDFDDIVGTALIVAAPELGHAPAAPPLLGRDTLHPTFDLHVSREPALSPTEPLTHAHREPAPEPPREPEGDPGADDREQQIAELAARLRTGERLTKSSAAEILGVSPATAGRRLRDARVRAGDGTGFYP
ncbi:hypothetical protein [Streptomyces silvensis]|uniref:Conjugal transfer protein n=1 Tax=Streptomyces silvensis TaxID=1765722 RepID=A0A0W7X6A0_9ACTN|nr:hypothetical protein [Streptomyces silvensis]KUF18444.1 hypothetical protein AT728_19045 [Streptomyces silvensis]